MADETIESTIDDGAVSNVIEMFGTFQEYRETLDEKERKKAEKKYRKLIDDEQKRLAKQLKHDRKEKMKGISDVLIQAYPGSAVMRKVKPLTGERLENPFDNKKTIYTGIIPTVLEIHSDIIPSWAARRLLPRKFRVRGHYCLWDQPFTLDMYSGDVLLEEKKVKTLIEQGFMDKNHFFLDEKGERYIYKGCYVKVDVSNIDFITSESHAYEQSKNDEFIARAMAKTGQLMEKMWMWIIIMFIIGYILTVFLMSGGFEGWF